MRFSLIVVLSPVLALGVARPAPAATFVVNSTVDPGDGVCNAAECTLREAITAANANPGVDFIEFNIPGAGAHLILVTSPLPDITETVSIDGSTEPGFAGTPVIEIGGDIAGAGADGLRIVNNTSQIGWLSLTVFGGDGIEITGSGNASVVGCYIGLTRFGDPFGNGTGVRITGSPNNQIGGTSASLRNVISGNAGRGIYIGGSASTNNDIEGNYIGTNVAGTAAIPNGTDGIFVTQCTNNTIGGVSISRRNVISGNGGDGVEIFGTFASGNAIEGNYIGTNAAGTAAVGNGGQGVIVTSPSCTIGGTSTGARNVISGNLNGIVLQNSPDAVVQNNLIGTNAAGTAAIPNQSGLILANADSALIGSTTVLAGNLISGNTLEGIRFDNPAVGLITESATIAGNFIGTDFFGTGPLPNGHGIVMETALNNTIGGTNSVAPNIVAGNNGYGIEMGTVFEPEVVDDNVIRGNWIGVGNSAGPLPNGLDGIVIRSTANGNTIGGSSTVTSNRIQHNAGRGINAVGGQGNEFRGNAIGSNGDLGIDLGDDGVTANDPGDADTGPNGLQNYPVLTSATLDTGAATLTISGTLEGPPATSYRVEFFAGTACDPSGFGEGEVLLASSEQITNALGVASFALVAPVTTAYTDVITATATNLSTRDTSEFSNCVPVDAASCGAGAGSCYIENGTAGCDDEACCNTVCDIDPFCCNTDWDALCVNQALDLCGQCGSPVAGPCQLDNGTPGCNDDACCATVCAADPYCCNTAWDQLCADAAIATCTLTCTEDCAAPVDGQVDVTDLLAVLAQWGASGFCDTDASGTVDVGDLLAVLAKWGACP